jgi:hypothetical protein
MQVFLTHSTDDPVRLAFPDVFTAVQFEASGPRRYNAVFLLHPGGDNDRKVRAAIQEAAEAEHGKKAGAWLKSIENNSNKYCYLDGNLKEYDGFEGTMALSAHRREVDGRVTVLDRNRQTLTPQDGKPYGGCYVNGLVDLWVQKGQYPGMRCGLLGVQFVEDGDAFGGGAPANPEEFPDLGVPEGAEQSIV